MARIKVDSTALRSKASEITSQIQQLQGLNDRLDALITRIGDSWEGEASRAYINMMSRYANQAKNMIAVMDEFRSYAQKAADEFDAQDRNGANRVRFSLGGGGGAGGGGGGGR